VQLEKYLASNVGRIHSRHQAFQYMSHLIAVLLNGEGHHLVNSACVVSYVLSLSVACQRSQCFRKLQWHHVAQVDGRTIIRFPPGSGLKNDKFNLEVPLPEWCDEFFRFYRHSVRPLLNVPKHRLGHEKRRLEVSFNKDSVVSHVILARRGTLMAARLANTFS
jgi:hypothetical protein